MASKSTPFRSNSFPSRSHPTTLRVEEVRNEIKASDELSSASSESICIKLCRLADLYLCMDDFLNLPSSLQALSQENSRLCEEFLDGSLRILDICGITREMVSQLKENVRDLQSCLRRRKGDSGMESSLNNYTCFRKRMKKEGKRSMAALKQIGQCLSEDDQQISAVIAVLREVNSTSIQVFQSVSTFLSAHSSKQKPSKWSLVSRLVHKGKVGSCEDESLNELENVDSALKSLCRNDQTESEKIQFLQNRLLILEASIDGVENRLEGLFRYLIRSRATLLNIFSC